MKAEKLNEIASLAQKLGYVFVATADSAGIPHVAAAAKIKLATQGHITVTEWFCPGTVANLNENKCISIVVWDKDSDKGYQLLGTLEKIEDIGIMDGYAPALETTPPMPQVERQLLIKVEKIIEFKLAPHSDLEE